VRRGLLTAVGATVGSALIADVVDRRRIAADPMWERLQTPPPVQTRTVRGAGDTPLHVELAGPADAPPVVLVHGWTCSTRFWRLQVHDLAQDHRVVAFDLRGHGASGAPADGDWSLDTLADDLEAVLVAAVGDEQPALLAGHSLGAMTIASWAGRYNDSVGPRASAVAMINTGLGDLISESLLMRMPEPLSFGRQAIGAALLGAGLPLPPRPDPVSHRAVRAIALSRSAGPAAVRFTEEMVFSCHPRVRAGCGRELSRLDLLHTVEHLNAPTLVIAGTRDLLTPPAHAHRLADALPDSRGVLELEGSGHMGPLERPYEVNAALRALAASTA
jgi:pimeloyl-ACP methyl ester carboxylesterase